MASQFLPFRVYKYVASGNMLKKDEFRVCFGEGLTKMISKKKSG